MVPRRWPCPEAQHGAGGMEAHPFVFACLQAAHAPAAPSPRRTVPRRTVRLRTVSPRRIPCSISGMLFKLHPWRRGPFRPGV